SVRAYGYYMNDESDHFQRLTSQVKELKVGGVCLFQGDIHTSAVLLNRLQSISQVPLLISSDFEWGAAMRLRRTTRFPEAMALGATRDTMLSFKMGKAVADEARAIGIHQVFAPVADVNNNPDNPVINTRSFGEKPRLVADMASAFVRGLQSGKIIATAKHFPGHGDTRIDSHYDLPVIGMSRERMDSVELYPFRRVIQNGVFSIMTAHLDVRAIEPKRGLPSSLSKNVQTKLLQEELGFDGLIVTDALEMGAVSNTFSSNSAAVLAVEAGADMILLPTDVDAAIKAIVNSIRNKRISEERINHSVRKILSLKQWIGLDENNRVDVESVSNIVASPDNLRLAKEIARASVTLLKNDNTLPLARYNSKKILNVIVSYAEGYRTEVHRPVTTLLNERVGDYFNSQLRLRTRNLSTVRIDPSTNAMAIDTIIKQASESDIIVVPIYSKARSGKLGLSDNIIKTINRLISLNKKTILFAFGSPYVLGAFQNASAYLFAYSDAEPSVEAAVEVFFGEIPTQGRLPVTIPGLFEYGSGLVMPQAALRYDFPEYVGFDPDSLTMLDSIMTNAINDSAFPGAQLAVVKDGAIVLNKSYGKQTYKRDSPATNNETIFDIASVTKVVATTLAIMKLYDEEKIRLDDSVMKYIPEFGNKGKEKITIRNLLLHNGGLPAFKRLFLTCKSPQEVLDSVYQTEMIYKVGDSTVYSDFDFILLGKIIEKISSVTLDKYVDSVFFKPLGMTSTIYNPLSSVWRMIAPTEYDSVYRKRLIQGEVHDENAFALGGVSGHAGLFSTASELSIFLQMIMNGGSYAGKQYLKSETIKLFTTRKNNRSTRALGWDTKTMNGYNSAGSLFGEKSFGHTGFTGTSVWVEPEKKIFIILLTNRVYPTRNNSKIMQIRPKVHDAVIRALNQ
ncbi:MAG: glycoside hydrolase family 3 N-terminal domain-containing protein, partial [Bacteroidota bacterium]|nr:glycoside hydrolase family 3 N-terminal domain-containing protein [Bacteroidota bacterium]